MNQTVYDDIMQHITEYQYNSLTYYRYEDVAAFDLYCNEKQLILMAGWDEESEMLRIHWAANSVDELAAGLSKLRLMKKTDSFKISFVPKDWVNRLQQEGYEIYAIWHDFWIHNIDECIDQNLGQQKVNYECLTDQECGEASAVTMSCRGQSRGFTGQTEQWIREWLNGTENSAVDSNASDSTVLIQRDGQGRMVGILCTTIYGHASKRGPVCWIREIAVHPDAQRQGIGRKLILQALLYGRERGAKRAFLAADENNHGAIHLYQSVGFVPDEDEAEINMIELPEGK